jgi:hypothetical protein
MTTGRTVISGRITTEIGPDAGDQLLMDDVIVTGIVGPFGPTPIGFPEFTRVTFENSSVALLGGAQVTLNACKLNQSSVTSSSFFLGGINAYHSVFDQSWTRSENGSSFFEKCIFRRSDRPVRSYGEQSTSITSSLFVGNTGPVVWEDFFGSQYSVSMCAFINNASVSASATLDNFGYGGSVADSLFLQNQSASGFGAVNVFTGLGSSSIRNSILWNNTSGGLESELANVHIEQSDPDFLVSNNTIEGWTATLPATGTDGLDPQLGATPTPGSDGVWGTSDDTIGDIIPSPGSPAAARGPVIYGLPHSTWAGSATQAESVVDPANWIGGAPTTQKLARFGPTNSTEPLRAIVPSQSTPTWAAMRVVGADVDLQIQSPLLRLSSGAPFSLQVESFIEKRSSLRIFSTDTQPRTFQVRDLQISHGSDLAAFAMGGFGSDYSSLEVSGAGLRLQVDEVSKVGVIANALLHVRDGAIADIGELIIAGEETSRSTVAIGSGIQGDSSQLRVGSSTVSRPLVVGDAGSGTILVNAESSVSSTGNLPSVVLGNQVSAGGYIRLASGATWTTSQQQLVIGQNGAGQIDLDSGSLMTTSTSSATVLGRETGAFGGVRVRAGATWNTGGSIIEVGRNGRALLEVAGTITASSLRVGQQGELSGTGTLPPITSVGVVSPGLPVGTLQTSGYSQLGSVRTSGALRIDIHETSHDVLSVANRNATLTGQLVVEFAPGFVPPAGTSWEIIDGIRSGTRFDAALLPILPGGLVPRVSYNDTNGTVDLTMFALLSPISSGAPESQPINGTPSAVVPADFDGDGFVDLAIAVPDSAGGQGAVFILRNAGVNGPTWLGFQSALQLVCGVDPVDLTAADLDADGDVDLAVANGGDGTLTLYRNGGTLATFAPYAEVSLVGRPTTLCAATLFFDADTDLPDLAVGLIIDSNPVAFRVALLRSNDNQQSPNFVPRQTISVPSRPTRTRPSDLDDDKRSELLTTLDADGTSIDSLVVFDSPSLSNASFFQVASIPVSSGPLAIVVGDLNSVPTPDVCVATQSGNLDIIRNTLEPLGVITPSSLSLASSVFLGNSLRDAASLDIDGDADVDVAAIVGGSAPDVVVLRNLSEGSPTITFGTPTPFGVPTEPVLLVGADVDNSGLDDVVFVSPRPPLRCPTCLQGDANIVTIRTDRECDTIDFNGNTVFPEDQDVIDFFSVLAGGGCSTGACGDIDFNNNGVFPEDQDVIDFLSVLAGGPC